MPYMVTKKQDARLDGFLFDIVEKSTILTIFRPCLFLDPNDFYERYVFFDFEIIDFEKNRFLGTKIDIRR
jgi:hypothetical protein